MIIVFLNKWYYYIEAVTLLYMNVYELIVIDQNT